MTSTDNAPRESAPRWFQRVLPVSGLVLAVLAVAALVFPGFREQVVLSATHRPESYVELYFARTPAGTQLVCTSSARTVRVSFAVTSHLREPQTLDYAVTVQAPTRHRRESSEPGGRTGTVAVDPGETVDVSRSFPRPDGRRYDVSVRVPSVGEQLSAHCPGTGS